jgi:hypothetical protein
MENGESPFPGGHLSTLFTIPAASLREIRVDSTGRTPLLPDGRVF